MDGTNVFWFMSGTPISSATVLNVVPQPWNIAGFDGNGKADILWRKSEEANEAQVSDNRST